MALLSTFNKRYKKLHKEYEMLINRKNKRIKKGYNGLYYRYKHPVLTAGHTPVSWRYDLNFETNPFLLQRQGVNATFNAGAILYDHRFMMVVRVEGWDRKSFFAIAESPDGISKWRFRDYPVLLPETDVPDVNVYDMRLTRHEDGWIYGLFCTERKDPAMPETDTSAAIASTGIVRTKDLINWERLPDLKAKCQQRNVVLHPESVSGKYALYTRPQDGFIDTGSGGGIGWALVDSMENAVIREEKIIDEKIYHTIKELKNGQGPPPVRTRKGWLHLAHGVRGCAAGLRYVLYMFMTDLKDPSKVIARPGGYFMAPEKEERIGDVSNVLFASGWIVKPNGEVYIYYASSDTRMHVASTHVDRLVDYVLNTPEDSYFTGGSVRTRTGMIRKNMDLIRQKQDNRI
ncbi:MAG: glycosidase [Bacteroidales bacterium]|nr:glycosidase [Bacteroidales bacterium]